LPTVSFAKKLQSGLCRQNAKPRALGVTVAQKINLLTQIRKENRLPIRRQRSDS
jgi:hypothetical protein